MEFYLVSAETGEKKTICIPNDLISAREKDDITKTIQTKGFKKSSSGSMMHKNRVLKGTNYDAIVKYLISREGKKPRGAKRILSAISKRPLKISANRINKR